VWAAKPVPPFAGPKHELPDERNPHQGLIYGLIVVILGTSHLINAQTEH